MDKIITISREYGAGGHSIGQQVAKELGIPFYDRDILKATVQTSGFDPDMVEHDQEDVSSTNFFFKSICSFADASFSDTQDAIHDVQKAVILHFAKEGPCVILGRCADEILREAGMESLNVFIHADAVHRAVRARAYRLHGRDGAAEDHCQKGQQPSYLLQPLYRQKVGRQP